MSHRANVIIYARELENHTFVIYKQFEHFLFKQCTFSETWFLRAEKLEMFILGTF